MSRAGKPKVTQCGARGSFFFSQGQMSASEYVCIFDSDQITKFGGHNNLFKIAVLL